MADQASGDEAGPIRITITDAEVGRIDHALALRYPTVGRKRLGELFDAGHVSLGRKKAKKGDNVSAGDVVELRREPVGREGLAPQPDAAAAALLHVVTVTDDVVLVAKPAGMPSQPLRDGERGTAANGLAALYPECAAIGDDARDGGLANRLDVGTSGLLAAARNPATHTALRRVFHDHLVQKTYLAITGGQPRTATCDAPLTQRGTRVVVDYDRGLTATTSVRVIDRNDRFTLVECTASTGRMHQIRAHLAHLGAPLVGDALYGGAPLEGTSGWFLHAATMRLPPIGSAAALDAVASLPEAFAAALQLCGLVNSQKAASA